jgi:hypothetical protein
VVLQVHCKAHIAQPAANLAPGVYHIRLIGETSVLDIQRLVVQ